MSINSSNKAHPNFQNNAFFLCSSHCIRLGLVATILIAINPFTTIAAEQLDLNHDSTIETQQTAVSSMEGFIEAAKKFDVDVRETTLIYESTIKNLSGKHMTEDNERFILDLISQTPDARKLNRLIPPGLPSDLEAEVLRILANLVSRISGLRGTFYHPEMANPGETIVIRTVCFNNVQNSQNRFENHIARINSLVNEQIFSSVPSDSFAAAELAIRIEYIWKINNCCDSCGGYLYETPIDINWKDHTAGKIGFDATFNGQEWDVFLHAG